MKPHEILIPELLNKIKTQTDNFDTGSVQFVKVTHINNPCSFYVRPICVNKYLEQIEAQGELITYQELKMKKRVIYYSNILGKFVRGEVEAITFDEDKTSCAITAVDYGCLDKDVPLINIKLPACSSYINCPPTAIHCEFYLYGFNAIDTIKYFKDHPAKMIVLCKPSDRLMVDLKRVECRSVSIKQENKHRSDHASTSN